MRPIKSVVRDAVWLESENVNKASVARIEVMRKTLMDFHTAMIEEASLTLATPILKYYNKLSEALIELQVEVKHRRKK